MLRGKMGFCIHSLQSSLCSKGIVPTARAHRDWKSVCSCYHYHRAALGLSCWSSAIEDTGTGGALCRNKCPRTILLWFQDIFFKYGCYFAVVYQSELLLICFSPLDFSQKTSILYWILRVAGLCLQQNTIKFGWQWNKEKCREKKLVAFFLMKLLV